MDAKEIKASLKAAREAIRTKDFETAARHCKAILDVDKKNYNALVFLGVAAEGLDQTDQALAVYRQAVEEVPDQPLAWQGYGSLLEKHPTLAEPQEAIKVFEKLLTLSSSDATKQVSILHKLAELYVKVRRHDEAYNTLLDLLVKEPEGEGKITSCGLLVDLLNSGVFKLEDKHYEQYFKCLNELLGCPTLEQEKLNKFITYLLRATAQHSPSTLSGKFEEMRKQFPEAEATLELSICFELEQSIGYDYTPNATVSKVQEMLKSLTHLNAKNWIVQLCDGFLEYQKRNFVQAKKIISEIMSDHICGLYYSAKSSLAVHNYSLCLEVCAKGVAACDDSKAALFVPVSSIMDAFKLLQAEALKNQGSPEDLAQAVALLEELKERKPEDSAFVLISCYLGQGKDEEAKLLLKQLPQESVKAKIVSALILMLDELYEQAVNILRGIVDANPENPVATLKLGVALWNLRDSAHIENIKQLCFNTLLKAAKLDPHDFESFLYLGHFYHLIQKDFNKARRCFQKAYNLNHSKDDVGCALVDILLEINEKNQAVAILKEVTSKALPGRGKWAWLRLGLYQVKFEDPTLAIASFQSALRADSKDHHVWECLAEAYLHRGSLTAALKAFTKASELKPDSIYSQYQMASVRQTLGLLPQAVLEYKQILEMEHSYVPVLKGLGESLILLARQHLRQCLDGLAQDCCEEALLYLSKAASQRPDFACLWKLMGDACNAVCNMASNSYRVPSKMLPKAGQNTETSHATKMQVLDIGSRCYSTALKILPENGSLWHDLGVSIYHQCRETINRGGDSNKDSSSSFALLERAKKAIQKALTLEPASWQHWNALGVMACFRDNSKPAFAQHCFIKSIECETNNVLAWSNLGALYLSQDQIQMAHDAFKAAQRLDPTYVVGWIGQALIAEVVGHEEVMDLFRHTTELAVHPESQLGYGQFVLMVLKDETKLGTELFNYCIHQMAAIPAASDALVKYITRHKADAIAYNMLGLLFEHQNLLASSIDAFVKSLKLLTESDPRNMKTDVQMNYARVLCKHGSYEESVKQFSLIADHLDFHHCCLYGLAEYNCCNFLQSLKVYQFSLERFPANDALRSELFTAMGMVALKAGNQEEAKSQLFNGFQTESPSFHGLLAVCALGLLQEDMTLVTAVLNELDKRPDHGRLSVQVAVLKLYVHILQGSKTEGECMLREMLEQKGTDSVALGNLLASYLVLTFSHLGNTAIECTRSTSTSSQPRPLKSLIIEAVAQLQVGQHNTFRPNANAFKTAQRAYHQNPGDIQVMCTLASASHAEGVLRKAATKDDSLFLLEKALLASVMEKEKNNADILCWCLKQLTLCSVELSNKSEAVEYLNHLKKNFSDAAPFVKAMELYFSSSLPSISTGVLKDLDFLSFMVAVASLEDTGENQVILDFIRHILDADKMKIPPLSKTNLLELLTHSLFGKLQETGDTAELKKTFEGSVNFAKEREFGSPIISLMHGMDSIASNKRLAKHMFATALDQSQARCDNGWCQSLARQNLISLLHDSTKESDVQLVEALLQDAIQDGDKATMATHAQLGKK